MTLYMPVVYRVAIGLNNEQPEGEHTWIHDEMIEAYTELHAQGFAHSIEVWNDKGQLIGGLYGSKNR